MAASEQGNQDYYFHNKKQEQEDEQLLNLSSGVYSHVDLQAQVRPQTEFNNINPKVWSPLGLNLRMAISLINQIRVPSSQPNNKFNACNIPADLLKIGVCELAEKPELCEEVKYQAKKHTLWAAAKFDFTKGEATTWRRHTLVFPPGILDDPFKNLMQCDNRLFILSQQPFPYHNLPIFQNKILDFSCDRSINGCPSIAPNIDHQTTCPPYPPILGQPIRSVVGQSSSYIPSQGLMSTKLDEIVKIADCSTNGKRDGILSNHEMDSGIPDEQRELQQTEFKNVAEFTNQEVKTQNSMLSQQAKQSDDGELDEFQKII
ncbi:hypothetical protein M8C21_013796, partial [Ambrosia artemisiifolia]